MRKPTITVDTLAHAEFLAGVAYTPAERDLILESGLETQVDRARFLRELGLPNSLSPAGSFDPRLPHHPRSGEQCPLVFAEEDIGALPEDDIGLAFSSLKSLSGWVRTGVVSSLRLTEIFVDRFARLGPDLECVVTITADLALGQAKRADAEIAAGNYRGPLHGIPWGAKDLLDTAGTPTTWGAAPYKDRIPLQNAAVVERLEAAGAVLVAKTTLGALAYGDVWFGGRTRNPWNREEGSAGSSAGSACSVAAGLVGFAIGTETLGSIVSPSMRCGTVGLRPTFGRVSRHGAMALCWSLDKIGPICRRVEDTAMVLSVINAADDRDPGSIAMPFNFDATGSLKGLRLGYDPAWLEEEGVEELDHIAIETARRLGIELIEIKLPSLPYDALWAILQVESAAAFEELTLSGRDDLLVRQDVDAWPNLFRKARLLSAVDLMQAQRFRRRVMEEMDAVFAGVHALIGPSFAGKLQVITNMTGHPSLTFRAGFVEKATRSAITPIGAGGKAAPGDGESLHRVPHGITLWGRLFDEGTLCRVGLALEQAFDVWAERPPSCD